MGFIFDLLTAPVLGPIKGAYWLAEQVAEAAEAELWDEDRVRGDLTALQMRLEVGEVTEEGYAEQENALLQRLATIREAQASRGRR